jgi:hypothetical protein
MLRLSHESFLPDLRHVSLPLLSRDDHIWRMGDHGLALIESESGFTKPIRQNRRVGFFFVAAWNLRASERSESRECQLEAEG